MQVTLDFEILASSPILQEVRAEGFDSFVNLADYIRQLPYGRPSCTEDMLAPLKERKGTCSFKHRLLAAVAHECGHPEIKLMVGLYEMSERNTPGVGAVLKLAGLDSNPEAHCYLQLGGQRYDFTGLPRGDSSPFEALIQESIVAPANLLEEKAALHRKAISSWAKSNALSFEDAWALREACIHSLK